MDIKNLEFKIKDLEERISKLEKRFPQKSPPEPDNFSTYLKALQAIYESGSAYSSFLQTKLQIGFNRAARLIDQMEQEGLISELQPDHHRRIVYKDKIKVILNSN